LYDDFGCSLKQLQTKAIVSYHGRLFLTDNYLCFMSNVIGSKFKMKLKLEEIKAIQKKKVMKIFDSGILITAAPASDEPASTKYQFGSFENRDIAYKRISSLWQIKAPSEVLKTTRSQRSKSPEEGDCPDSRLSELNQINQQIEQGFEALSQAKGTKTLPDASKKLGPSVKGSTQVKTASPPADGQISDPKIQKPMGEQVEEAAPEQPSPDLAKQQVEDKDEPMNQQEAKVEKPVVNASDEELKELAAKDPDCGGRFGTKEGWKPLDQFVAEISVSQFFEEFLAEEAPFGFDRLSELLKHTQIQKQPFKEKVMDINMVVPLTGVPFVNQTRCLKQVTIVSQSESKLVIEMDVKTFDAPYCDTFICKEAWVVLQPLPEQQRCIVVKSMKIHFVKSTFFKGKIQARSEQGMQETAVAWLKHAQQRGHLHRDTLSQKPKLSPQASMPPPSQADNQEKLAPKQVDRAVREEAEAQPVKEPLLVEAQAGPPQEKIPPPRSDGHL